VLHRSCDWTNWTFNKAGSNSRKVRATIFVTWTCLTVLWTFVAANKDELMEMITAGAEKIINTNDEYEGLNLDDLNNFKLDVTVQQWECEDFRSGISVFLMQIF
jgi:hypothetical protein